VARFVTRTSVSAGGGAMAGFTPNSGWTVTGTAGAGNIATITRAAGGLSIPTDPRPDYWAPLASVVTKDATYSKSTSPTFTLQTNASFQSVVKPTNSAGALDQLIQASPTNGSQPGVTGGSGDADTNFFSSSGATVPAFTITNGRFYVSMDRYRTFDPQTSAINGKNLRIWTSEFPSAGADCMYISEGFIYSCNLEGTATAIATLKGGADPDYSPFIHPQNSWFKDEWTFKESSANTIDGFFDFCRNGSWAYGTADRAWNSRPTDAPNVKTIGYFSQYSANGVPPDGSHEYIANVYVSGGFRVLLTTESTYGTTNQGSTDPGVKREPQLPVQNSGSATGVQILQRNGVHASDLKGLYMYLIDDNEVVYQVGRYDP